MPFTPRAPKAFSARSIWENAPQVSGVYGISNAREWIFIGETDNLRDTLMQHLRESNSPLQQHLPTGFAFETCQNSVRSQRMHRLREEYSPCCNR